LEVNLQIGPDHGRPPFTPDAGAVVEDAAEQPDWDRGATVPDWVDGPPTPDFPLN